MATFDKDALKMKLWEVVKKDPEWIQFEEERDHHYNEWSRLNGEVEQLEKQKNETKYEEERKVIEKKIAIKSLEADLAWSKKNKAISQGNQRHWELKRDMLQEMKTSTSDVMKSEIQRLLEEAEREFHRDKESANEYQSKANSQEDKIRLLKKEGHVAKSKSVDPISPWSKIPPLPKAQPYSISVADQPREKFKVLEESEATQLAFAVGDMHVSPSKVAKTEIEPTTKPYKMVQEQIKQKGIKSSPIEDPGCQLAKAMITGVTGSDSKETDSDSKEAPSEQPPKEKASSSLSAAETCMSSCALQRSTFFEEARIKAKIPFLHHQVLECDSSGGEFNIVKHDITVEIPKGCVSEGEKLCLEVGVAMYGPFKFTDDSQPISPILWLCFLNENVKVNKPIKITVPHFLTGLTESRLLQHRVSFAKANHLNYSPQEDYIVYNFEPSEDKTQFISRNDKSYGVLETTHCCFLCIKAKRTPLLAKDAGYRLARVERKLPLGDEIHFAALYGLDTCYVALKEQYPNEDGYIFSCKNFKFEAEALKITVPKNDDQYLIAMDPLSAKILASEIDFFGKTNDVMLFEHKNKMYPPRVKMEVRLLIEGSLTIDMKFSGSQDDQLDVRLPFPLAPQNTATSHKQPASTLTQQHTTDGDVNAGNRKRRCESGSKETVRQMAKVVMSGTIKDPDRLFNYMSKDIGDKYGGVGIDLGIAYQTLRNELETEQFNMRPANEKAMRMLQIWKRSVAEEDLTYSKLAAALEKNDLKCCAYKYCYTTCTATASKQ